MLFERPATFALPQSAAGEVAEWSKAQHWKCCIGATLSRVRIPPSPLDTGPRAGFLMELPHQEEGPLQAVP